MPKNIKCKNCDKLKNHWCRAVIDSPDEDMVRDCRHFRHKTNADRIRAMSDEELGRCLVNIHDSGCFISFCKNKPECAELLDNDGITDEMCMECMMQWLKQPAEVDNES